MKSEATDVDIVKHFAVMMGGKCLIASCQNPTPRTATVRAKFCSKACVERWMASSKEETALPPRERRQKRVYFVECPFTGQVKIGISGDVLMRMKALQTMSPTPLRLIGTIPGTVVTEIAWHQRWRRIRRHGEWFELTPALLKAINDALSEAKP